MKIRVVCSKCHKIFEWPWGKQKSECEHCKIGLHISEVKMAAGEIAKLLQ